MAWFNRERPPAKPSGAAGDGGFGAPFHLAYDPRRLPNGGAMSVAFETLALPRYTPIGWGVANQRALRSDQPVMYQRQGVTLGNAAGPGILAGSFMTQPLLDTSGGGMVTVNSFPAADSFQIPSRKAGG